MTLVDEFQNFLFNSPKNVSTVVENHFGTSKHQFILKILNKLSTYNVLMSRQVRLETKSFMIEISGTITKTIALQSSPSKQSNAYGAISKVRLFPAPAGADTNTSLQDTYSRIVFP